MKNYKKPLIEMIYIESEDILFSSDLKKEESNIFGEGAGEIW